MPKKKKTKEEFKEDEESELEEEAEEQPEIDTEKLNELLQSQENTRITQSSFIQTGSPILNQVEIAETQAPSLEQGLDFQPRLSKGKEEDTKYETIKDFSEDYEDPSKRKSAMSSGDVQPISVSSHIDMASIGRGRERMGQEFTMTTPEELSHHPESARNYEAMEAKKGDQFKGEKTDFQQQMDKRYEIK